jgi:hypothetical protein
MIFWHRVSRKRKATGTFTIANHLFTKINADGTPGQRATLGSFGRNTASNPIAGRNAQT